jgi:hypothetical protein
MGKMTTVIPQGPNMHCGDTREHSKHVNEDPGFVRGSWCDGVPPLSSFVELTIRVDLERWAGTAGGQDHETVLKFLAEHGFGVIIDGIGHKLGAVVLRVRTEDRDKVYPIIKATGSTGLTAVVMPDGE